MTKCREWGWNGVEVILWKLWELQRPRNFEVLDELFKWKQGSLRMMTGAGVKRQMNAFHTSVLPSFAQHSPWRISIDWAASIPLPSGKITPPFFFFPESHLASCLVRWIIWSWSHPDSMVGMWQGLKKYHILFSCHSDWIRVDTWPKLGQLLRLLRKRISLSTRIVNLV